MSRPTRSDLVATLGPANGPPTADVEDVPPARDPVSPFCHDVLALFHGPLADVRFPDIDRDALDALAAGACVAQREVEALEAALEAARARTLDAQSTLAERAGRALAYARVFASGQPALEEALATVRAAAPRAPGRTPAREPLLRDADRSDTELREGLSTEPARRRGRPRREASTETLLPMTMGEASAE